MNFETDLKSSTTTTETFRDHIATVDNKGKRNWIYPKKPSGKFYDLRKILSYFYLIVFFSLPFLKINGHPAILLNILERKFVIFGSVFWPHDFFIFGIAMLTFIVFVVLFTVVFGRLFCGWACPQTIFLEMVFRRFEYWIEGDATHQKALNAQPWNKEKILKKGLKFFAFFIISFIISNTFLAYIIGKDELFKIISEPLSEHWIGLSMLLLFTLIFYFVFAWFREQVCIIVCPYGRLQGVMLDKNSIIVAYDYVRGENRSKFKKNELRTSGDCIDCGLCVKVCPTGIDIRNGTQLECVNCTACIDVCNDIMKQVKLPQNLIRYDSEEGIKTKNKKLFTKRTIAYSIVLFLLVTLLSFLIFSRSDVETTILRTPGTLFQKNNDGTISNLYNLKIINKTQQEKPIELQIEDGPGYITMVGDGITVKKESKAETTFFVFIPKEQIKERKTILKIGVYSNGTKIETVKTNFLGPAKFKN